MTSPQKKGNCYFCSNSATKFCKHIPIDADIGDDGQSYGIYADVWLCERHYEDYTQSEGIFDPYKYL